MVLKSRRNKQFAVRHLENKKLQANCNLGKIHKQFGKGNSGKLQPRQTAKRLVMIFEMCNIDSTIKPPTTA